MSVLEAAERVRFLVDGVAPSMATEPVRDPDVWKAIHAKEERAAKASEVLRNLRDSTATQVVDHRIVQTAAPAKRRRGFLRPSTDDEAIAALENERKLYVDGRIELDQFEADVARLMPTLEKNDEPFGAAV